MAWMTVPVFLLAMSPGARASTCTSFPFNPWLLNAVVLGDVGTSSNNYANTDIEGAAVVLGNGYFTGFDFNWVRTWSPTNIGLYVGGSLTFTNGQAAGGMEIAGNAYFTSSSIGTPVSGPVSIGGSLSGGNGGGTINGDLVVAGSCSWCDSQGNTVAHGYKKTIGGNFDPTLDLTCIESYFQSVSPYMNGAATSGATWANSWGTITITLPRGTTLNYVTIPAATLSSGYTVNINGASSNQELIINVVETTVTLSNTLQFNYNTITNGNVLVNMPNCVTLTLGGSYNMNLLAPFATTSVAWSHITGNIIVKSLQPGNGMMQINDAVYCTITALPASCSNGACGSGSRSTGTPAASPSSSPHPSLSPLPSPSPVALAGSSTTSSGSSSGGSGGGCTVFPFNPWQLNVIVFGDVGSASSIRGADFEGAAAAMGSVWYQSFSVDWVGTWQPSKIGHYVGGDMTFYSGSCPLGGLEVAGNLYLNSITINGPVSVGGNFLTGGGGSTVDGDVLVAGTCSWCQSQQNTISGGSKTIGGKFAPTLSFSRLQSYYQCIAQWAGSFADTTTYTNNYGTISINLPASGTRHYVTIPSSVLTSSYNVNVQGSSHQELIVNVPDSAATLGNWLTWSVSNGIPIGNVLLNMPTAATLTIGSGGNFNLLAPFAVTSFNSGVTTGNFIVKQLLGGNGQINDAFYTTISFPLTCPNEACASTTLAASPQPSPSPLPSTSPVPSPAATPSPSPIASHSPAATPSTSPVATASASPVHTPSASPIATPSNSPAHLPSASPKPSPTAGACAATSAQLTTQYPYTDVGGCDAGFYSALIKLFNCTVTGPGCTDYFCPTVFNQAAVDQILQCQLPSA